MAKQTGILKFTGKLGDVIGYRNKKDHLLRSAPETIRQTAATKRAARDFGTASKAAKLIRHALPVSHDSSLTNRLNKALGQIVRADDRHTAGQRQVTATNIQSLNGFQFNKAVNINHFIQGTPVIDNSEEISISFPEIAAGNKTSHIAIRAIALSVNFAQQTTRQLAAETIILRCGEKLPALTLNPDRKDITLIMLEIQSCYEVNGQLYPSQHSKGYALDIIAVLPPVEKIKPTKQTHNKSIPNLKIIPQAIRKEPLALRFYSFPEG